MIDMKERKKNITFHQRWSAYINKWTLATQQPSVLIQRLVYMFNPGLLLQIKTGTLLAVADCVPDGWLEFTPKFYFKWIAQFSFT